MPLFHGVSWRFFFHPANLLISPNHGSDKLLHIVPNAQVSDTTGDAMKNQKLVSKKS